MNKSKTNFIIDVLLLLGMMFLTGTGFVRKYILLGGSASREAFGRKMNMYMLGYSRDDWSTIHLYTGYFILFLLLLHIVLHWKQVTIMYKQLIANSVLQIVFTVIFIILSVLLVIFPFILEPSMIPG
ncbi:MAG: DUF4405 domain-containing protein [Syntrophomonadaceae bacterium]|nr:DUF4405 domain-containing protein [Syntrophomonadaceae bacterium]